MHILIQVLMDLWSSGKWEHLENCLMPPHWLSLMEWKLRLSALHPILQQPPLLQMKWSEICALRGVLQALSETLASLVLIAKFTLTSVGPAYQTQPESWGNEEVWGAHSKSWYYWWLQGCGDLAPIAQESLSCTVLWISPSISQNFNSSEVHSLRKPGIHGKTGRCRS